MLYILKTYKCFTGYFPHEANSVNLLVNANFTGLLLDGNTVCMCVCVCACVFVFLFVCVSACVCFCVRVSFPYFPFSFFNYLYSHTHAQPHTYICMYICV